MVKLVKDPDGAPKPGLQTTEFWLAFGAQVVCSLLVAGVFPVDSEAYRALGALGVVFASMGYGHARGLAKKGGGK